MVANTPAVLAFEPFIRAGNVFQITPAAQWVDTLALAAGTAKSYTTPTGTVPSMKVGVDGEAAQTVHAKVFRITANGGPVYVDVNGNTAAIPTADNTNGNGPIIIPAGVPYMLVQPVATQPLSFIAAQNTIVAVEAWY